MNPVALFLITFSIASLVAGELLLKHAMQSTVQNGYKHRTFIIFFGAGSAAMASYFFLTLGLLQKLDLSYLFPFQGLSVLFIGAAAAVFLREKLDARLILGSFLITAGVVLVSMS